MKRIVCVSLAFLLLFAGCRGKGSEREAEKFCDIILNYCINEDYEELIPYFSDEIMSRNECVEYNHFVEIIRSDFPHDLNSYEVTQIFVIDNMYLAEVKLNNGYFNMYFELIDREFKITEVEFYLM